MRITKKKFIEATGSEPRQDDLERCNCKKAGEVFHYSCGWCEEHDKPRFICGCHVEKRKRLAAAKKDGFISKIHRG
jgi:hypothetical protein